MNNLSRHDVYGEALISAVNAALYPPVSGPRRSCKHLVAGGVRLTTHLLAVLTETADRLEGCDIVYVVLKKGAANPTIDEVIVSTAREEDIDIYGGCRLWQPSDPRDPMLIVGQTGYFAAGAAKLTWHLGTPAETMEPGYARAWRKLQRMALERTQSGRPGVYRVPVAAMNS